jgi:hypothetical protein
MHSIRGVLIVAFMSAIASAAPTIVFRSTPFNGHTGSISYDPRNGLGGGPTGTGTGNIAVGSNIDVDDVTGIGTLKNSGVAAQCFSCTISFHTGAATNDTSAAGTDWSFSGGGYFQVIGGFDLDGDGNYDATLDVPTGTLLLTGVFNNPVTITNPGPANDSKFASATLVNIMDNRIDAFFGTPGQSVYDGVYSQTFDSLRSRLSNNPASVNYNRWRVSTYGPTPNNPTGMLDGSVVNTLVVPEPVSLLLFGTTGGIIALCMRRRKV